MNERKLLSLGAQLTAVAANSRQSRHAPRIGCPTAAACPAPIGPASSVEPRPWPAPGLPQAAPHRARHDPGGGADRREYLATLEPAVDVARGVQRVAAQHAEAAGRTEQAGQLDHRLIAQRRAAAKDHVDRVVAAKKIALFGRQRLAAQQAGWAPWYSARPWRSVCRLCGCWKSCIAVAVVRGSC